MNKTIFTLVVVLLFGTLFFTGCSKSEAFVQKSYASTEGEISSVIIDVRDREIAVSLSPDNQVHIDYFESEQEFYDIAVSDDRVLTMTARTNKDWKDFIGFSPETGVRKISLQVPDSYLSSLDLSTTKKDLILSALTVTGDVTLSSNGGNITFGTLNVGNALRLTAKNGNISGTVAGTYDDFAIETKIKKGKSNLPSEKKGGNKTLKASNNNGDIDIEIQ